VAHHAFSMKKGCGVAA